MFHIRLNTLVFNFRMVCTSAVYCYILISRSESIDTKILVISAQFKRQMFIITYLILPPLHKFKKFIKRICFIYRPVNSFFHSFSDVFKCLVDYNKPVFRTQFITYLPQLVDCAYITAQFFVRIEINVIKYRMNVNMLRIAVNGNNILMFGKHTPDKFFPDFECLFWSYLIFR